MSCSTKGHPSGCNCPIARGLTREQAEREDIERASGVTGPTVDELEIDRLRARVNALEYGLNEIAMWSEGERVSGKFDEPGSATIARRTLGYDEAEVFKRVAAAIRARGGGE